MQTRRPLNIGTAMTAAERKMTASLISLMVKLCRIHCGLSPMNDDVVREPAGTDHGFYQRGNRLNYSYLKTVVCIPYEYCCCGLLQVCPAG